MTATSLLHCANCNSLERAQSLISQPNAVFVARRLQGSRCRLLQFAAAATLSKITCMSRTFSRPSKLGVVSLRFVNGGAIKVGKPGLDVPCRNENRDFPAFLPHVNVTLPALIGKLPDAANHSQTVAVDHDNQINRDLILLLTVFP